MKKNGPQTVTVNAAFTGQARRPLLSVYPPEPWRINCRVPGCVLKRRGAFEVRASVLDCGSPLPLSQAGRANCRGEVRPSALPPNPVILFILSKIPSG